METMDIVKKHRLNVDYIFRGKRFKKSPNEVNALLWFYHDVHGRYTTRIKHIPFGDKGISLDVEHLTY